MAKGGRTGSGRPSQALIARLRQVMAAVEDPLPEAQGHVFDAMEAGTLPARLEHAARAIAVSPLAADAWGVLAEAAPEGSPLALELWRQAVAAGTLAVGPGSFVEDVGDFWGILETRPYMRARAGLAMELRRQGRGGEAVAELEALLRLNPNDNQGLRYLLMDWLLEDGRDAEAGMLHERYAEDGYAGWVFAAALLAFRRHGAGAEADQALGAARAANPHMAGLLAGTVPPPRGLPGSYTLGSLEEAMIAADTARAAWAGTPGALAWLAAQVGEAPKARGRRPGPARGSRRGGSAGGPKAGHDGPA